MAHATNDINTVTMFAEWWGYVCFVDASVTLVTLVSMFS